MPRSKSRVPLATLMVLLMLAPATFIVLPAASAQDTVPVAPSILWNGTNLAQRFYVNFADLPSGQPDCQDTQQAQPNPPPGRGLGLKAKQHRVSQSGSDRSPCNFAAAVPLVPAGAPTSVKFSYPIGLLRSINVTGNDSINYHHEGGFRTDSGTAGGIPTGMQITVRVESGSRTIGTEVYTAPADENNLPQVVNSFDINIRLGAFSRFELARNEVLSVTLSAVASSQTAPTDQPPTWSIADTGSYLEVRSHDALRTATWIENEKREVTSLFRPIPENQPSSARLVGIFAVESAFGINDARGFPTDTRPVFTILRSGEPILLPGGSSRLTSTENDTLTGASVGRMAWSTDLVDYRTFKPGDYELRVDKAYHQGTPFTRGITRSFVLSAQSIRLTPFDDNDPTTFPSPLETTAHDVQAGGTTTYVFLVNNTGSANDTIRLDASFISGAPATGWAGVLGGPFLRERTVQLAPLESKLVTLTVSAPSNAAVGNSAVFQVDAVSSLDPSAKATPLLLISTVTNTVTRELAVVTPAPLVTIEPGQETIVPIYVWNRGTRLANISLEVRDTPLTDWTNDLLQGQTGVRRLLLSNVRPGDLVEARMRLNGPINDPTGSHDVFLNATSTDAAGVSSERLMRVLLRPSSAIRIEVLEEIRTLGHRADLRGNVQQGGSCDPSDNAAPGTRCLTDHVNGMWYRVWITNTGKRRDTFELTIDNPRWSTGPPSRLAGETSECRSRAFAPNDATTGAHLQFFHRTPSGGRDARNTVALDPGQTGELYLWRQVNPNNEPCVDDTQRLDFYDFVINVRGLQTGASAREATRAVAVNTEGGGASGVLIEAVRRISTPDQPFSAARPYVDLSDINKPDLTGFTALGTNATYFVRITNAASWGTFTTTGNNPRTIRPEVSVNLLHINQAAGWNASIRPVREGDVGRSNITNPWVQSLTFTNEVGAVREGWYDQEFEIQVQTPSAANKTAFARESMEFIVQATMPARDGGPTSASTLKVRTVISELADINLATNVREIMAHPGEAGMGLLYVFNNGSAPTNVTIRSAVDRNLTQNAAQWVVEPASQSFQIPALTNRTIALAVTPPPGQAPNTPGRLRITAEYPPVPDAPTVLKNETFDVDLRVVQQGTLDLIPGVTEATIQQGEVATFNMTLRNLGSSPVQYRVTATPLFNWNESTVSEPEGTLPGNGQKVIAYVLKAPLDLKDNTRFSSIVHVEEIGVSDNFDSKPVNINIRGGKAIASVTAPTATKTVDRNGVQTFEAFVRNIGSTPGRMLLEARAGDPAWSAGVQNSAGANITSVLLGPNEVVPVNVTVRAPFNAPENAEIPVELIATTEDLTQSSRGVFRAKIHDYGVDLELVKPNLDIVAGSTVEFVLRLRNTGNDNDTLNVSANLAELPEWTVDMSHERVRLEPGQSADVRAIVRSPTAPLPAPRSYTFKFYAGTLEGILVNQSKNDTVAAGVTVLNYRALDVDGDDLVELAVDADRRAANGFEEFKEIFTDGLTTNVVARAPLDGKARFFLDVPDPSYDGIADVWYDPETVYAYRIIHVVDLNTDATPEFFIDSNRDQKLDLAYDPGSDRYGEVVELKLRDDGQRQYLIDLTGDGRPDRYFDPQGDFVTRTQNIAGADNKDLVGIDTNNDKRVDRFYNVKTKSVSDATVATAGSFAKDHWYFFVAFGLLAVVTVALLVRRRRTA